eukprot:247912_1
MPQQFLTDREVREGKFRVKVVDKERNSPLPLIFHESDYYAIAEAGREFEVEVGVANRFLRSTLGSCDKFICYMSVDGKDIGRSFELDCSGQLSTSSHRFDSFDFKCGGFRCLKFDSIQRSEDDQSSEKRQIEDLGVIEIEFHEARVPDTSCPPGCDGSDVAMDERESQADDVEIGAVQVENSAETKKFWKDPSLSVAPGKPARFRAICQHRWWIDVKFAHMITIYYDTADRLRLRGVLKPNRNPQYRRYFPEIHSNGSVGIRSVPNGSVSNGSVSSGSVSSGSVSSGSVSSGSVPSASDSKYAFPKYYGGDSVPAHAVVSESWDCGACSKTNGPRAKECMFCGIAKGELTKSSDTAVKREHERA